MLDYSGCEKSPSVSVRYVFLHRVRVYQEILRISVNQIQADALIKVQALFISEEDMKKLLLVSAALLVINISPAMAHHPAEDIVDEDIYAMIDSMVADTPHANLTFDEMGGMTETTVSADSIRVLEDLIVHDDLLEYIEQLDGVVDVSLV